MRNSKVFIALATLPVLVAASACGKPFNIRPRASVTIPDYQAVSERSKLVMNGVALTDEDFLYETFNANLILAGVLPVRLKMTNDGSADIELRRNRFEIRTGGRSLKSIEAERAFKRMLSFYGVKVYNKIGYKQSKEAFLSYGLDLGGRLRPGSSREGIVFFEARPPVERDASLVLVARGVGGTDSKNPLELKLK